MAITDAVGGARTVIYLNDFDNGLVVSAFNFSVDVRIGSGTTARPADGFSISYAREGGAILTNHDGTGFDGATEKGYLYEVGTNEGLAICFDAWQGNQLLDGPDIEGVYVRVDGVTVLRYGMPTRNGECDDITSLQTGPQDVDIDGNPTGDPSSLCWQKVTAEMTEDAKLTVTYKGATLIDHEQTAYFPSAGRFVFAGRTGGANQNQHIDNLEVTTVGAEKIIIGPATGLATGFYIGISDSGQSVLDPDSVTMKLDGADITGFAFSKTGGNTTVAWESPDFLEADSTHTVEITASDTNGQTVTATRDFTVPAYGTIPASYAVSGTASDPGMNMGVYQMDVARYPGDENSIANAEMQWAHGYIDPATGQPYADVSGNDFDPMVKQVQYVNWEQAGGDIDATPEDGPDHFNSALPETAPIANTFIPGIPWTGVDQGHGNSGEADNNIVVEVTTYLKLDRGLYRMGVNSDDGFKVSVAPGQPDVFGIVLGSFSGGKGASDVMFDFVVEQDGYYPFRLLWWEGAGGANVEWFTEDVVTGERFLVGGPGTGAIKAFKTAPNRAHVAQMLPANGWTGHDPQAKLSFTLEDGTTSVVNGSVKLLVDGEEANATVTKSGTTTKVNWTSPIPLPFSTPHAGQLVWTESTSPETVWTNDFTFTIRPMGLDDLPAGTFAIDAEMFDSHVAGDTPSGDVNGPYTGDEYDGLSAVSEVDYHDGNDASDLYRQGETPNVPMNDNLGGALGAQRPGFEVTTNYKIGWTAAGEWYNYTRTIPAGFYTLVSVCSHGNAGATVGGDLGLVTEGVGTENQTVVHLASARGPAPGGWGNNAIQPALNDDGTPQVFKMLGGEATLRFTKSNGDFDWFALVPAEAPPATMVSKIPGYSMRRDAVVLEWTVNKLGSELNPDSVELLVGDVDMSSHVTITENDLQHSITADLSEVMLEAGTYTYTLNWADNATPPNQHAEAGEFKVNPYPTEGTFVIEAEDFNYDGGQTKAEASVMPYVGGAYADLSAVAKVDYDSNHGNDSDVYRIGEDPNVNMNDNLGGRWGADRGSWEVTSNYKIGWASDAVWGNYTRTIPAANYQVWAALSYGGTGEDLLRAKLYQVSGDTATEDQTLTELGAFHGAGTGGWGANELVPMTDADGNVKTVDLGGETTLRFVMDSGDFDYFLLVPTGASPAPSLAIGLQDGQVVLTWEGDATLQSAEVVTGPYADVAGATSPYTVAPTGAAKFYRLKQ
jgi:hypothetical protein